MAFHRGFSLIEAMMVVAVLGIIAAVAVPSLLPVIQRSELGGATDNVVGFVSRARVQAFSDRRCVQLLIGAKVAGQRQRLTLRELNTYDCDGTTAHAQALATAPRIVAGGDLWLEIDALDIESPNVIVEFVDPLVNAEGHTGEELRFRGNGRLWSATANTAGDDMTIRLRHERSGEQKQFRVASNGVVVDRPGGT